MSSAQVDAKAVPAAVLQEVDPFRIGTRIALMSDLANGDPREPHEELPKHTEARMVDQGTDDMKLLWELKVECAFVSF
jgi:hypothetical protein